MTTANLFDKLTIASDPTFGLRVKASLFQYCTTTVQSDIVPRRDYATQVIGNPNNYLNNFVWAAAVNQTLADGVVTSLGRNFTTTDLAAAIATAVAAATDTNINSAVAASFNAFANS